MSRTRIGMNSFFQLLKQHTTKTIAETEIIPYPTPKLKQLKKESKDVIARGKKIFLDLLLDISPSIVIMHGKTTVDHMVELLMRKGLLNATSVNLNEKIESMEQRAPLFEIPYQSGKIGKFFGCRHFMYYGQRGESFNSFKGNIIKAIESI
ncbi:MAG: hypothetical protein SCK28_14115 [Bacillota bacterium]|nr:hypothetical protein [Bacillota bacterium]